MTQNIAKSTLAKWKKKPQTFFKSVLGVDKIWSMQDQLLSTLPRAIKENKHIYIASGHSLGKDWVCGGIGLWFLYTYSPSIVILTAPTRRQVEKVMWGETMSHWNNKKIVPHSVLIFLFLHIQFQQILHLTYQHIDSFYLLFYIRAVFIFIPLKVIL